VGKRNEGKGGREGRRKGREGQNERKKSKTIWRGKDTHRVKKKSRKKLM